MPAEPQFLTLEELYQRKRGREAVVEVLAYLPEADHDEHVLLSLRWAEARFRSLTKARYGSSLPADPAATPDEIKGLVADLARYNLELEHADNAAPNAVTLGERAIAQLRDVAAGRASLDLPETVVADRSQPELYVESDMRPDFASPLFGRLGLSQPWRGDGS